MLLLWCSLLFIEEAPQTLVCFVVIEHSMLFCVIEHLLYISLCCLVFASGLVWQIVCPIPETAAHLGCKRRPI